jgi:hypothetical protein
LREYVLHSLALAEKVRSRLPERFIVAPTSTTYQQFHSMVCRLGVVLPASNMLTAARDTPRRAAS